MVLLEAVLTCLVTIGGEFGVISLRDLGFLIKADVLGLLMRFITVH